ncbi:MAG: MetS family NSS transporter small subunit [Candidatus Zixiibacteriota bacterium]
MGYCNRTVSTVQSKAGGEYSRGIPMKPEAIIFMILILSLIWGGFIFLLSYAFRKDKKQQKDQMEIH